MIAEFEEVTDRKARYVRLTNEQYKGFLPPPVAQELLENHLLIGKN